ncbi:hypothetical protein IQ247_15905 [Plectonema cf. radiosum LEGE 06105]|uniref:Uncharacterized protein n=1 Tax=Plectonema cf. radiosum LEGE 06105 TaxID=945769 RepID=A0A8J7K2F9_9CYAN|nr:hypothetical protein [Plectonema radiosum]MBE9214132.1 hypothetical protein [Plectonema cf. radiosum LEGE 06105]
MEVPQEESTQYTKNQQNGISRYSQLELKLRHQCLNVCLKITNAIYPGLDLSSTSPTFPDLDIVGMIPQLVGLAFTQGTRRMLKSLREQL